MLLHLGCYTPIPKKFCNLGTVRWYICNLAKLNLIFVNLSRTHISLTLFPHISQPPLSLSLLSHLFLSLPTQFFSLSRSISLRSTWWWVWVCGDRCGLSFSLGFGLRFGSWRWVSDRVSGCGFPVAVGFRFEICEYFPV